MSPSTAPAHQDVIAMFYEALKATLVAPEDRLEDAVSLAESYQQWVLELGYTHADIEKLQTAASAWYQEEYRPLSYV
jgi:hypothetical protein